MTEKLSFNKWSRHRIAQGKKFCTSRKRIWDDPRVVGVIELPWNIIRNFLYDAEGADSPNELQRVINQIHRKNVGDSEMFFVHFGNFKDE